MTLHRQVKKGEKLRLELAAVSSLLAEGKNKTEVATALGKSITWVTARIRLLK